MSLRQFITRLVAVPLIGTALFSIGCCTGFKWSGERYRADAERYKLITHDKALNCYFKDGDCVEIELKPVSEVDTSEGVQWVNGGPDASYICIHYPKADGHLPVSECFDLLKITER